MQADLISSINKNTLSIKELIALRIIFNSNDAVFKFIKENLLIQEILLLAEDQLTSLGFRKAKDILIKLNDYEYYEQKSIEVMDWCLSNDVIIISYFCESYPSLIKEIPNPSCLIFCLGNIKLLKERNSIAVVGTRKCSKYGSAIAKGVSSFFALKGINVVSGLALGIDTIAHEQSLASHGNTTAVLIDIMSVSPSSNSELAQRIDKNNGLLLSENLPGTPPEKYHYVARNRLQVALSKIVFIIEASNKSGTKATAEHAIKQGKQIYCPEVSIIADYPESIYEESLNKSLIEGNKAKTFTKDAYDSILESLLL